MPNWGQGAQGAAGGAAAGSAFGPWGAAIGAGIGGLGGLFGGGGNQQSYHELPGFQDRYNALNQQIGGYQGPNIGNLQQAGMGGKFREGQLQLMGQLQEQAAGRGPSLASAQFDRSLEQGVNTQMAQANTGVGNGALAARNAMANTGQMTQQMAGQAAQARMAEQMQARQQLIGLTGQGRGQEMQGSQFNAGQFNNAALQQARMGMDYNMGLRDLELRNSMAQQQGMSGFGNSQGVGMGQQILMGGASAAANYFANRPQGQRGQPQRGPGSPIGFQASDHDYGGYNPY